MLMQPLAVLSYTITSAAGLGKAETARALREARSGLVPNDLSWAPLDCWIGRVGAAESVVLPEALSQFDCRNNRLALFALEHDGSLGAAAGARGRLGAGRTAFSPGTSPPAILPREPAYRGRAPARGT